MADRLVPRTPDKCMNSKHIIGMLYDVFPYNQFNVSEKVVGQLRHEEMAIALINHIRYSDTFNPMWILSRYLTNIEIMVFMGKYGKRLEDEHGKYEEDRQYQREFDREIGRPIDRVTRRK